MAILKMSEAASLALHTMVILADEEARKVNTHEISAALNASEAHLSKVLQRLVKAGLVSSTRGPKGGFRLGRPAEEITLLEVYESIEGRLKNEECFLGRPVCGGDCLMGDLLHRVNEEVRSRLAGAKLSELRGRRWLDRDRSAVGGEK